MSQNGQNPHDVPGSFGSQPPAGWQSGPPPNGPQGPPYPYPPGQYGHQPPQGPQQPWGYPPPQNQQPGKPNRTVLAVIGGVVGVALIGGTVYAVQSANSTNPTPRATVSATAPPSANASVPNPTVPQPTVPTASASDAVASYLRALGAGDATTVLSLAATQPTDSTFLTNGMLAKTTAGKIGAISVAEVSDPNATSVDASYTLAGKPVTTQFEVTQVNGQFRLNQVAAEVNLAELARVPLSVAGTRPTSDQVLLFPGVYPVTPVNKLYSLGSVKVTVPNLDSRTPGGRTVALSSAGRAAIIKATSAKYKACLKQNSTKPKGCYFGVSVPSGVKLRTSSIAWTTRGGAKWSKMKPKLVSTSVAQAKAPAKVHFYARDARVSGRYWYKDINIRGVQAVISGKKVTVSFY